MRFEIITQLANLLSTLSLPEAAEMYLGCVAKYGIGTAVRVVKIAEVYRRTKCGEIGRDEAVREQDKILREVTPWKIPTSQSHTPYAPTATMQGRTGADG